MAMDDRLRQSGGPRGEEHAERVVEVHRVEFERPGLGHQLIPFGGVRELVIGTPQVREVDHVLERRQRGTDLGDLCPPVDRLLAVAVAGDRQQQLRVELAEAVDHAARPELRRAGRPDRTEAGAREEGDQRLGDVRQIGDDAVPGADPEALQPRPRPGHLFAQLAEGEIEVVAGLRSGEHGDLVGVLVVAHHVLGVVETRAGEPLGAGHLAGAEHPLVRGVGADLEEVPERAPEALQVVDRPAPELVVSGVVDPPGLAQPVEVAPKLGGLPHVGGGSPHHRSDLLHPAHPDLGYCQVF